MVENEDKLIYFEETPEKDEQTITKRNENTNNLFGDKIIKKSDSGNKKSQKDTIDLVPAEQEDMI